MKYTILHISDLHKGEHADLNNLFVSLERDCLKYTQEGILKPSIIVISGDVVNGAEGENAIDVIRDQYNEVSVFLEKLVNFFLDGDRNRIVIVPGNHDMCREYSRASMRPSLSAKKNDLEAMRRMNQKIRWSWEDFQFHEIASQDVYESRFSLFADFYNKFFDNIRSISGNPEEFSDVVDLPDYGISFALFNSCYHLDHLNVSGSIFPTALTNLDDRLRKLYKKGRLLTAVWHHHTMGLPPETNYLDYRILQTMLSYHISVGLYGHQHKSQVINTYSDIDEEESMLLICSGSLYGQRKQLSTGYSRQYNLITVEHENGSARLSINVRADQQPDYDIPSWTAGLIGRYARMSYEKKIDLYKPSPVELIMDLDDRVRKNGDFDSAVRELIAMGNIIPHYNLYLDEYLSKSNLSPEDILTLITNPNSETQALLLIDAAIKTGNREIKDKVRSIPYLNDCQFTSVKELLANL